MEAHGLGGLATGPGAGVSSCGPGGGQGQTRNRLGLVTVADTIKLFWGGLGVHISIPVD